MLAQGFSGIFLDTLDDAAELERQNPNLYGGMRAAALELVKAIRGAWPKAVVMVNRAYDLLPDIAADINIELGESVTRLMISRAKPTVAYQPKTTVRR